VLFGVYGRSYYFDNFDGLYRYVSSIVDEFLAWLSEAVGSGHGQGQKKRKRQEIFCTQ
jgi:hypothetical protein